MTNSGQGFIETTKLAAMGASTAREKRVEGMEAEGVWNHNNELCVDKEE